MHVGYFHSAAHRLGPALLASLALGLGVAIAAGCTAASSGSPASSGSHPSSISRASSGSRPSSGPPASSGPPESPATGSAAALLARLAVKGRAPRTGYDRGLFGAAWTDDNGAPDGHNGCDTRNDVLRRDLLDIVLRPDSHGCVVLTGTLEDPYTGARIAFRRGEKTSARVQIDHVVALSDAWQKGAQQWSEQRRVDFANDPLELLAVDGSTNESKSDGDAATWLPPNKGYRCAYVARQIAVKATYRLWVTRAEHDAMARVLRQCPQVRVPSAP